MYNPKYSKTEDQTLNLQLIAEYPLGLLISNQDQQLQTSYLPFVVQEENDQLFLLTHLARANPQWKNLDQKEVVIQFQGPDRYMSPVIYKNNLEVPTWNYAVVKIAGTVTVADSTDQLDQILNTSVSIFEKRNQTNWSYKLPEDFKSGLMKAIVGLKIKINKIDGKFKLSQNKRLPDYEAVQHFLQSSAMATDQEMLKWMNLSAN